ncbi:MAG: acetyl-CoA carboxylase biotin carboxyl carrier protein subunit [Bacteroidales bacterium]|jgi:biotin carboxyl carrier protein
MEEIEEKTNSEEKDYSIYQDINIDNILYSTIIPKKNQERKPYKAIDPREIYVFIPGTILKIFVKKKDKVKKGEKLITFQAMKMDNVLLAPMDGVIENVFVKEGENVNKSQILIKIK